MGYRAVRHPVLPVLKGFFSGSEIAIVNSDKLKLGTGPNRGTGAPRSLLKMFRTPDVILGTTLVGTNLATVTISTLGALICIHLFGESGDLISVLILTPFLLIFGEIVPKSVFQQKADTIVGTIIHGLRFFSFVFYPVIFVFSRVARFADPAHRRNVFAPESVHHPRGAAGPARHQRTGRRRGRPQQHPGASSASATPPSARP